MYRLDRNAFKKQSLQDADHTREYWLAQPDEEKLRAAMYLNSIAYDFPFDNPPRMDRTFFQKRIRR